MNKITRSSVVETFFAGLLILVISAGILVGMGLPRTGLPFIYKTVTLGFLAWAVSGVRWFRNCIFFPVVLLMALFFPVGYNYGLLNEGQVASLFATDALETVEFLGTLPWYHCAVPFFFIAGLFVFFWIITRRGLFFKGRIGWGVLIVALALAVVAGDFRPVHRIGRFLKQSFTETQYLAKLNVESDWKGVVARPRHQINLLVIGESERRDYMHAYGYPIQNTPFMESVPGVIYEGFTSEGDGTLPSLKVGLTWSDEEQGKAFAPRLNIIDLARDAGFSTSWFSNQGYATKHDTPITAIAAQAHHSVWLKLVYCSVNSLTN